MRIVTEAELRQALADARVAKIDRDTALNELDELRDWFTTWTNERREWAGNPQYPLELIEMIENAIKSSWPEPLQPEDLS